MTLLALVLFVLAGLAVGILGGGGSILSLPILLHVALLPAREAIPASLVLVSLTSLLAAVLHGLKGHIDWKAAFHFGLSAMAGAWLGGNLSSFVPESVLLIGFALLMALSGVSMVRSKVNSSPRPMAIASPWLMPLQGLGVGAITGFVGAGGGFLIVPALVLWRGLPMRMAVGTSALLTATNSLAGALGQLQHTSLDFQTLWPFALATMLGASLGVGLSSALPQAPLKRGFGVFAMAMSCYLGLSAIV